MKKARHIAAVFGVSALVAGGPAVAVEAVVASAPAAPAVVVGMSHNGQQGAAHILAMSHNTDPGMTHN